MHTDAKAAESARAVNALAFTLGQDVVFASGRYAPATDAGRRLLAHELTHTLQQRSVSLQQSSELSVGDPQDAAERAADATAERVVAGPPVNSTVLRQSWPHLGRTIQRQASVCPPTTTSEPAHPGICPELHHEAGELERFARQGPKVETLSGSCWLLRNFGNDRADTGLPAQLQAVADLVAGDASASVQIVGYSDCVREDGIAANNTRLRQRRAASVKSFLALTLKIDPARISTTAAPDTQYVDSNATQEGRARNRSAVIHVILSAPPKPPVPPGPTPGVRVTKDFVVVAKSYIAVIGSRRGTLPLRCVINPDADVELAALAKATDLQFHEDPKSDAQDKEYRLFSRHQFTVTCEDGKITNVLTPTPLETDVGNEGPITPPPLIVQMDGSRTTPTAFDFAWSVEGRPALAVEPGFQLVCLRRSRFIWHEVHGHVACGPGGPTLTTTVIGSHFPSHRVFVNGVLSPPTIVQGPFSNLWVSDSADPSKVE